MYWTRGKDAKSHAPDDKKATADNLLFPAPPIADLFSKIAAQKRQPAIASPGVQVRSSKLLR